MKFRVKKIQARRISDSNGQPTVHVQLETDLGVFCASVPSGISTGKYEALVLEPDKAIKNIEKVIAPILVGRTFSDQEEVDLSLLELDGTKNKSRLGANAILPVSIVSCRALAASQKLPLFRFISKVAKVEIRLPRPSFNLIEGGKHADNGLTFQEFMIVLQKESFQESLETGKIIYERLKNILKDKFGEVKLSREGAFSPPFKTAFEAIDSIVEAGQGENIKIAIDAAGAKGESYQELIAEYPIVSIEDPFAEEDYKSWATFLRDTGPKISVFGDDLTVTNVDKMKIAKEKKLCNAVIIKPNQIGTVSETIEAVKLAKSFGWKIMVANRAGETEDDFIADLAAGTGADFIKSGAPYPKERMAKYQRLVEIEKELKK